MEIALEMIIEKIKKYNAKTNVELIKKAFYTAKKWHEGQFRSSGEPYFIHPLEVANICADLMLDDTSIAAAFMHDLLEDTRLTFSEMEKEFGAEVAQVVEGLTKLEKIPYVSKEEQQIENIRKMLLAISKDVRVILIKLADRLHNMRTLKGKEEFKRRETAHETLNVYAPLAHRLGIYKIKYELEDLSIKYLDPVSYAEIRKHVQSKRKEREEYLDKIMKELKDRLEELAIKAHVEGRVKHFYSIFRKVYEQKRNFDELYDLFAVRIIVDTVSDCYAVLGMVHELYKPMPGRFKDYISIPKPNGYKSLHSTLIGTRGTPFEIQIRTWDMHETAEYGIAAHWKYKEGTLGQKSDLDSKISWIRQLVDIDNDEVGDREVLGSLKVDLFSDQVFVFTPKGAVINLPAGSTTVDFAFAIHSAVGSKMMGAKVGGNMVNIDYVLKSGDVVEILTNPNSHPSADWLRIAKTSSARNKINQWIKKEKRDENILKGKEMFEKELKKSGYPPSELFKEEYLEGLFKKNGFNAMEDVYANIGFGSLSPLKVINRLKDEHKKAIAKIEAENFEEQLVNTPDKPENTGNSIVIVKGIDDCLTKISRCCSPLPGDEIIGYITRGRGVTVHRKDCSNMLPLLADEDEKCRFIDVEWPVDFKSKFMSELLIKSYKTNEILKDIFVFLSDHKIQITSANVKHHKEISYTYITIEIGDNQQLEKMIEKLKMVNSVLDVVRNKQ